MQQEQAQLTAMIDAISLSSTTEDSPPEEASLTLLLEGLLLQDTSDPSELLNNHHRLITNAHHPSPFQLLHPRRHLTARTALSVHTSLLTLKRQWLINYQCFSTAKVVRWLQIVKQMTLNRQPIFSQAVKDQKQVEEIISKINEVLKKSGVLYLFEREFVMRFREQPPPKQPFEYNQWLYFQLLPIDYHHLPAHHLPIVRRYHPVLATHLAEEEEKRRQEFRSIRMLISGHFFRLNYTFSSFLACESPDSSSFQRYFALLDYPNYTWATHCLATHSFHHCPIPTPHHPHPSELGQLALVPFLSLFRHSSRRANIGWHFDGENSLQLQTLREVEAGEELQVALSRMPMQVELAHYGTVDVESDCYIDIPVHLEPLTLTFALLFITQQPLLPTNQHLLEQHCKDSNNFVRVQVTQDSHQSISEKVVYPTVDEYVSKALSLATQLRGFEGLESVIMSSTPSRLTQHLRGTFHHLQHIQQQLWKDACSYLESKVAAFNQLRRDIPERRKGTSEEEPVVRVMNCLLEVLEREVVVLEQLRNRVYTFS